MPYVPATERKELDQEIAALAEKIRKISKNETLAGNLNYSITSLLLAVYGKELRYHQHNEIVGLLECAKQEFYRRLTASYEDKKCAENGEVFK